MYKLIYEKTKGHIKLDIVDMLVAEYIISVSQSYERLPDDPDYFWVAHAKLIKDLPELYLSTSKVYRIINTLIDAGLIVRHGDSKILQRTYYKLTAISLEIRRAFNSVKQSKNKSVKNLTCYKNETPDTKSAIGNRCNSTENKHDNKLQKFETPKKVKKSKKSGLGVTKLGHEYNRSIIDKNRVLEEEKKNAGEKNKNREILLKLKSKESSGSWDFRHRVKEQERTHIDLSDVALHFQDDEMHNILNSEHYYRQMELITGEEHSLLYQIKAQDFYKDDFEEYLSHFPEYKPANVPLYNDIYQLFLRRRFRYSIDELIALVYFIRESGFLSEKTYLDTPFFHLRTTVVELNMQKAGKNLPTYHPDFINLHY